MITKTSDFLYHAVVGNDAHPILVATIRAIIGSAIIGTLSFLSVWQTTDDMKTLIISGASPALLHLAVRMGLEGWLDTVKRDK